MTPDSERLERFVREAKAGEIGDDMLIALLRQNGWSERRTYAALAAYYEAQLGLTIPTRGGRVEYASDAFVYLLAFISLGFWSFALGKTLYALIDRSFPDLVVAPDAGGASLRESVSWELATILVAFPIFMFVSRAIARGLTRSPERRDSGVRKWLTYIALVISAVVLLGDGIVFLNAFLGGELTVRFGLQTLVLLAIAGGIFSYYLLAIRSDLEAVARDRAFASLATLSALVVLACGFGLIGTPAHGRQIAADDRRLEVLADIANWLKSPTVSKSDAGPPTTLSAMPAAISRRDPSDDQPYEYRRLDAKHYRLCARFETVGDGAATPRSYAVGMFAANTFAHGIGRKCFDFVFDTR